MFKDIIVSERFDGDVFVESENYKMPNEELGINIVDYDRMISNLQSGIEFLKSCKTIQDKILVMSNNIQ
jgi:hypothetical protein